MRDLPSSLVLAYLGDAVLELYVRKRLVAGGPALVRSLHRAAAARVSAAAQAAVWSELEDELTPEETAVARRARNAQPKHAVRGSRPEHHLSTALEAVLGYLYLLGQQERLDQLLERIWELGSRSEEEKPCT
ncbi:MAG: ribonuclease III [Firmicutes bacterium]|jgi:ribonuclease-3 family protein|nr:ribonuclease III [Bacillota bacterium]